MPPVLYDPASGSPRYLGDGKSVPTYMLAISLIHAEAS